MRVVFVAAECEPWAKTGGLGDVVDALARALGHLSEAIDGPVDVFLPRYRSVPVPDDAVVALRLEVPDAWASSGASDVEIVDVAPRGYRLRLVDHPPAFDRSSFYGEGSNDYPDNAWRFGLFSRSVLEALRADGRPIDVIHLHDWQAGPVAVYRDGLYPDDPIVGRSALLHTVHNLAYHGWTAAADLPQLGLQPGDAIVPRGADGLDLLYEGLRRSELVNTVSPGFAAEALTPEYGMGLDALLRSRGDRFFGILNGLDTALWDPSNDAALAAPFSAEDLTGKAECRADLLGRVGLDADDPSPILGMIGRLDPQKGFDLVAAAADQLIEAGGRIVLLGSGDAKIAASLRATAAARPGRLAFLEAFDRDMARRIYAGSDLFLMPSRFEPCGQGQMIAFRYGTPPVVRRTGGLADTVVDADEKPREGTGFVFDAATPDALVEACVRAMEVFRARSRSRWNAIVRRGMALDFDWDRASAPRYAEAYTRAARLRAEAVAARS